MDQGDIARCPPLQFGRHELEGETEPLQPDKRKALVPVEFGVFAFELGKLRALCFELGTSPPDDSAEAARYREGRARNSYPLCYAQGWALRMVPSLVLMGRLLKWFKLGRYGD